MIWSNPGSPFTLLFSSTAVRILWSLFHRDAPSFGCRVHQWQKTDAGVVGMPARIEVAWNDAVNGKIWVNATEEISNWEFILPRLYEMYNVINNPHIRRYYSLKVEGKGKEARYTELQTT
ncbi:MAG TPA: hypothetical protein VLH15_07225 [Dehalococcoidales bacterium]|nr:hypothetical protein [Dehalococcoidales bacterium]